MTILTSTVNVQWEDPKGIERDCDVLVEYTYDGDVDVLSADIIEGEEPYGISESDFDDLVDAAVAERAPEAYADWLSGQDDSKEY
jgi:hypothetical protein